MISLPYDCTSWKAANPNALVDVEPLGNFAVIVWAFGPRLAKGQEAHDRIVIHGVSASPWQDLVKVYNARRRQRHGRRTEDHRVWMWNIGVRTKGDLKYLHSDTQAQTMSHSQTRSTTAS